MHRALIYIGILIAVLSAQVADNFTIHVSVEFLAIDLFNLAGEPYISYTTVELGPGDTVICDSIDGIWIDNQSNIPVGFLAWAFDDTAFILPDSGLWNVEPYVGFDTCATGLSIYGLSRIPDISDVQWLTESIAIIASGLAPDEDRYGYIFFVAPTDPVEYGEPQHRMKMIIGIFPE